MTRVETAIVGAGFAGIAMAIALQRAGRRSFVLFERAESVGGTWRENTYPGVACDVPSHLYGLADYPNPLWSSVFADGAEIHEYLERVVHRAALADRLNLNTNVTRTEWTGDGWLITAGEQEVLADYLVLACGRLTEPRVPEVAGLHTFAGPMFHSARWDHTVVIEGKRVAVVGTGASAIQLVPKLAHLGAQVTLFQRTPAWIVPRGNRTYAPTVHQHWLSRPSSLARIRRELFEEGEARYASRSGDAAASAAARDEALTHLLSQTEDPVLREQLTPTYSFGCKRVLLSDDFYPVISSGAVKLEASALATVSGNTVTAENGAQYEVDVLVLATGFEAARQPYAQVVIGENNVSLDDHWSTGMTSVGSTLVAGFPNLFIINGPNASLGHNSAVLMMEAQASFVSGMIAQTQGSITVSAAAEADYTREIIERSAATPWVAGGCNNWYVDDRSGRLTLLWPGTVAEFNHRLVCLETSLLSAPQASAQGKPQRTQASCLPAIVRGGSG